MSRRNPTTTTFALLGRLAVRPGSAYELTQQMQRATVRWIWPRAESRIYGQLKVLEDLGYATTESDPNGRRRRTVYTITASGRKALRQWLDDETATPWRLEDEILLRISLADNSDLETLRRNLTRARAHLVDRLETIAPLTRDLAETGGNVPTRLHISALMAESGLRELAFRADLLDWIERATSTWTATTADDEALVWAKTALASTADEMDALLQRLSNMPSEATDSGTDVR